MSSSDPRQVKADLRKAALARRDALSPAERQLGAQALAQRPFPVPALGAIVSGFMPLTSEINPLPLMRKLAETGARLALPVVVRRGEPLLMRSWAVGEPLGSGVWGIREPLPEAPIVDPDILIVPLAAFDRRGERIGYGAGYYDRTIARLRLEKPIVALGVAFAVQQVEAIPATPGDERLDFVMTERETLDCRTAT